jgi:acetylornithine deacetylase/succinyl-diaminopimelate desuccinylase-like protein
VFLYDRRWRVVSSEHIHPFAAGRRLASVQAYSLSRMSANVQEILELSSELIRFAAVSTGEDIAYEQIHASFVRIRTVLEAAGLNVIAFDGDARFPAIYCDAQAPGSAPCADTLLAGHFDVVPPHDELQLEPTVDGD